MFAETQKQSCLPRIYTRVISQPVHPDGVLSFSPDFSCVPPSTCFWVFTIFFSYYFSCSNVFFFFHLSFLRTRFFFSPSHFAALFCTPMPVKIFPLPPPCPPHALWPPLNTTLSTRFFFFFSFFGKTVFFGRFLFPGRSFFLIRRVVFFFAFPSPCLCCVPPRFCGPVLSLTLFRKFKF